jgi:amino acid transporter
MSTNEYEKGQYAVEAASHPDRGIGNIVETKGAAIGEAADVYGDVATAEQFGYVERQ